MQSLVSFRKSTTFAMREWVGSMFNTPSTSFYNDFYPSGILDMTSFTKFLIKGEPKSVVKYLQLLCSNDVDIPVGNIITTGMLNDKGRLWNYSRFARLLIGFAVQGGQENDCILIHKSVGNYFMVSPTQQQTRILEWMENHLPDDNSVVLQDVTSMFGEMIKILHSFYPFIKALLSAVLSIAGPKSKNLVQEMTRNDLNMPPFTCKYLVRICRRFSIRSRSDSMILCDQNMGFASGVMVFAGVTQTGEPGYSLYVHTDYATNLYDRIMNVGQDYGIKNVGQIAMRFHRIEKFIPFWGEELTAETTPIECGRTFKVKFDKDNFIGKEALLEQRRKGVLKRLVQLQLTRFNRDVDPWPWGGEAIYRNDEFVG
jgi:pyruvate dehydrogenase phosphatase regulatory subunit